MIKILVCLTILTSSIFADSWITSSGSKILKPTNFGFFKSNPVISFEGEVVPANSAGGDVGYYYFDDSFKTEANLKSLIALMATAMSTGKNVRARVDTENKIIKLYVVN